MKATNTEKGDLHLQGTAWSDSEPWGAVLPRRRGSVECQLRLDAPGSVLAPSKARSPDRSDALCSYALPGRVGSGPRRAPPRAPHPRRGAARRAPSRESSVRLSSHSLQTAFDRALKEGAKKTTHEVEFQNMFLKGTNLKDWAKRLFSRLIVMNQGARS